MTLSSQRNSLKEGTFTVTFIYSFLLSPFNIGCYNDFRDRFDKEFKSVDDRIRTQFSNSGVNLKTEDEYCNDFPIVHMSEELVPPSARLPLYHRFPHISLEYSLGEWRVKFFKSGSDGLPQPHDLEDFDKVIIRINTFVFESGAGITAISVSADPPLESGDNLSRLKAAIQFGDFVHPNAFTSPQNEKPYIFDPPEISRKSYRERKYLTLQKIFLEEKKILIETLRSIFAEDDENELRERFSQFSRERFENNSQNDSLTQNIVEDCIDSLDKLKDSYSIDEIVLQALPEGRSSGHNYDYYQSPFIVVAVGYKEHFEYDSKKIECLIGAELGYVESDDIKDEYIPSRFQAQGAKIFSGSKGALICFPFNKSNFSEFAHVVMRVYGSLRLTWHSLLIMNAYMGRQLISLSDQFARIRKQENYQDSKDVSSLERNLEMKRREISELFDSIFLFMMAEDPMLNSVHFSEYSALFLLASKKYNFQSAKEDIWKKADTLRILLERVNQELDFKQESVALKKSKKSAFKWLMGIMLPLGVAAILYLKLPSLNFKIFSYTFPFNTLSPNLVILAYTVIAIFIGTVIILFYRIYKLIRKYFSTKKKN